MGQQMIRKIRSEMELVSLNYSGKHYFFLDEVDQLTAATQREMKTIMNMRDGVFIFCTNRLAEIDDGLRDRCLELSMNAVSDEAMFNHAMRLAKKHNVVIVDEKRLRVEVSRMRGSFRHLAQAIKRCSQ
jgi:DNA polymerase III delta prime subunit